MIFALALAVIAQAPQDAKAAGLSRVFDKRGRSYAVHLEVVDGVTTAVSDYTLELGPEPPPKPDKKTKEVEKPKPGGYVLRLTDLRWHAGTLSRRQEVFGSGVLRFEATGFPSEFLDKNWILSPLFGFYVPDSGPDATISEVFVGGGWKLTGKGSLGVAAGKTRTVSLTGTLAKDDGSVLQLDSEATMDLMSGWPKECHGTIDGSTVTVNFTAKLR